MSKSLHFKRRIGRFPFGATAAIAAGLMTSACAQSGINLPDFSLAQPGAGAAPITTGSIASSSLATVGAEDALAKAPATADSQKSLAEARALRDGNQKAKALAVLEAASQSDPTNKVLLRERGLIAADLGRLDEAKDYLRGAIDEANPDWRTHSALGSALAAEGNHGDAQREFARALELSPDNPSVLNNLALSYALDGKHEMAEGMLRQAAERSGNVKTKQNLALLLGLKGRTDEARQVAATVLPRETAVANAGYLSDLQSGSVKVSRAEKKAPVTTKTAQASQR